MKVVSKISRGAIKDYSVLNFAGAMLETSLDKNPDAILRSQDNSNYKLNKRIDRRVVALRAKTKEALNAFGDKCDNDARAYTKKRLGKVSELLHYLEKNSINVNLELLAIYMLYVNFNKNERKSIPIYESFVWFTDDKNFFDENSELIGSTLSDETESNMFMLAYDCIEKLKG